MKFCNQCSVSIETPAQRCPLCYAQLSQQNTQPELQAYPDSQRPGERYHMTLRVLLFLSLTVAGICLLINILTFRQAWWSLIVIGSLSYIWIMVLILVKRKSKIGFSIMSQFITLSLFLYLIDRLSGGHNWSLNYVIPFLAVLATMGSTLTIMTQRVAFRDFFVYFLITAILGFIPIILMAFQYVSVLWPSLSAAIYCGISLLGMFIFADKATKNELKKRFHL